MSVSGSPCACMMAGMRGAGGAVGLLRPGEGEREAEEGAGADDVTRPGCVIRQASSVSRPWPDRFPPPPPLSLLAATLLPTLSADAQQQLEAAERGLRLRALRRLVSAYGRKTAAAFRTWALAVQRGKAEELKRGEGAAWSA